MVQLSGVRTLSDVRWGYGRDATWSVSLGSAAGAFDTPYTTTDTTIPTEGRAIPRQLSVASLAYYVVSLPVGPTYY
jgi:hypothetical protein